LRFDSVPETGEANLNGLLSAQPGWAPAESGHGVTSTEASRGYGNPWIPLRCIQAATSPLIEDVPGSVGDRDARTIRLR